MLNRIGDKLYDILFGNLIKEYSLANCKKDKDVIIAKIVSKTIFLFLVIIGIYLIISLLILKGENL